MSNVIIWHHGGLNKKQVKMVECRQPRRIWLHKPGSDPQGFLRSVGEIGLYSELTRLQVAIEWVALRLLSSLAWETWLTRASTVNGTAFSRSRSALPSWKKKLQQFYLIILVITWSMWITSRSKSLNEFVMDYFSAETNICDIIFTTWMMQRR